MFQKEVRFQHLLPLFLALVFLSLFSNLQKRASWMEQWAYTLVFPFQKTATWISGGFTNTWNHYFSLVGKAKENEGLQEKVQSLQSQLIRFEETKRENERLYALMDLKEKNSPNGIVAQVVAFDPRAEFKTLTINKGAVDGLKSNWPVMSAAGLVGRLGPVTRHSAQVLLLIDPNSVVDVIMERSRVRGLLTGAFGKTKLRPGFLLTRLEYLRHASDVVVGDVALSSGLDLLYPKGLPVGTVSEVEKTDYGIFKAATVLPFVEWEQLEEVLVLRP